MIGIKRIGVYIPNKKIRNLEKLQLHNVDEDFINDKIGILSVARKETSETTSDLCALAFKDLKNHLNLHKVIDCICVCTQNGDYTLPHTSAILHSKLRLSKNCAAFDISLGCSGYVYSLQLMKSFMEINDFKNGLVFTCDPYSSIINPEDRNTDLLFGDAATVTLVGEYPVYEIGKAAYRTDGDKYDTLIKEQGSFLYMNGREIFNFVLRNVPENILRCLELNSLSQKDVDLFLLHQASKFITDNVSKRMNLDLEKVPFSIQEYGNTVSSTIPILLRDYLENEQLKTILLSAFGVGLSIGSLILRRC